MNSQQVRISKAHLQVADLDLILKVLSLPEVARFERSPGGGSCEFVFQGVSRYSISSTPSLDDWAVLIQTIGRERLTQAWCEKR